MNGYFHRWAEGRLESPWGGPPDHCTIGIVESEEGAIMNVAPADVRFVKPPEEFGLENLSKKIDAQSEEAGGL